MKTKTVPVTIGSVALELNLPAKTDVLAMKTAQLLSDPAATVAQALKAPIAAPPLERIVREKLREKSDAQAVVVISDNTRPVPYRGESGILWPIVKTLMDCGMESDQILIGRRNPPGFVRGRTRGDVGSIDLRCGDPRKKP